MIISHIKKEVDWSFQSNKEHQEGVAKLASEFASEFGMRMNIVMVKTIQLETAYEKVYSSFRK